MKKIILFSTLMVMGVRASVLWAQPSTSLEISPQEIEQYRALGYQGIDAFLQKYKSQLEGPKKEIYERGLDQICQQKDCYASRLYWHTDFAQAQAEAKRTNKPILALRMLGKLTEDLSCANSRFFRVALYPNREISTYLREHFILHWETVRPVPKLTIDFGDGRTYKSTITGNSIHYVVDEKGQVLDAFPGLYGPEAFLNYLKQAQAFAKTYAKTVDSKKEEVRLAHHEEVVSSIQKAWESELKSLGIKFERKLEEVNSNSEAERAGALAITKSAMEMPILRSIRKNQELLTTKTEEQGWTMLAQKHMGESRLDASSKALLAKKQSKLSKAKNSSLQNASVDVLTASFEKAMALDTVRNGYVLRSDVYRILIEGSAFVEDINSSIYHRVFLMPLSDPSFGLLGPEYNALDGGGL